MYTAQITGPRTIEYKEVPMPEIKEGEALIRVKAAGLCGSDMHKFNSHSMPNMPTNIYGHEISGVVEEISTSLSGFELGDRVVVKPILHCDSCEPCEEGAYQFCEDGGSIGKTVQGGFADYVAVPTSNLYRLNPDVPFDVASLADPLAVAVHNFNKLREIDTDDSVAIIGDGAIGLLSAYVAKQFGYSDITVFGKHKSNLAIAKELGADTFYLASGDVDISQHDFSNSKKIVIELVGGEQSQSMKMAVDLAARQGEVVFAGVFPPQYVVNYAMRDQGWKELSITGSNSFQMHKGKDEFETAVEMINRDSQTLEQIVSHKFPLSQITQAVDSMNNKGEKGVVKIVLEPSE